MAIVYNEKKQTFSLHTAKTTYQLKIGNLNYVNHLYYGATIRDEDLTRKPFPCILQKPPISSRSAISTM